MFIAFKELIKKKTRGGKPSAERRKKLQKRWNAYQARIAERRRQDIRLEPLPRPLCTYYLGGFCNKVQSETHEGLSYEGLFFQYVNDWDVYPGFIKYTNFHWLNQAVLK